MVERPPAQALVRLTWGGMVLGRLSNVGVQASFTLLPTFSLPHYSIVLGAYAEDEAERLLVVLGPVHDNPHHVRRPK